MQEMENQDNNRELWWTRLLVWNTHIDINEMFQEISHTLLPNISFKGLSPSAVMEEEIWAVKADINIIPMIIHSEAYARPRNDLGVLSPYLPKKSANYKMKNVDILRSSTNSASQANLIVISVGKFASCWSSRTERRCSWIEWSILGYTKGEKLSTRGCKTSCYLLFLQTLTGAVYFKVMFLPHCCHGNNGPPQTFPYAAPKWVWKMSRVCFVILLKKA